MNRWNTAKKTNDKKRSLITKGTRDSGCVGKIRARSVHFPPLFLAEISSRNASYRYFRIGIRTSMFPSRLRPMFSVECFACTLRVVREYLDADRNFPIRAEVSMRSGDPTLIALLIAALTYIREVVCRRRSTRERHACVESDSAERKEKPSTASRAYRDHLSLRSSWRAHERSWNTRCSLHAYLLDSPSTWNQAFLNICRCLSTCRLPAAILFPPIPPRLDRVACFSVRGSKQHRRSSTFISSYVREDETRRRVGC